MKYKNNEYRYIMHLVVNDPLKSINFTYNFAKDYLLTKFPKEASASEVVAGQRK